MLLSRRAQRLFKLLRWCASKFIHTFPKQIWLAQKLDCSVRTIKRALQEIRGQLVNVSRRYRRSNVYRLLESPQMELELEAQESPSIQSPVPMVGPTIVKSNSRKIQRLQMFTPLVLFRNVYKRYRGPERPEEITDPGMRAFYGLPDLEELR